MAWIESINEKWEKINQEFKEVGLSWIDCKDKPRVITPSKRNIARILDHAFDELLQKIAEEKDKIKKK